MAFDAGAIEGTLTLDRSPFNKGMQQARKDAQAFQKKKYTAKIDVNLNDKKAQAQIKNLTKGKGAKIGVNVNTSSVKRAQVEVDGFGGRLEKLAAKVWSIKTLSSALGSIIAPAKMVAQGVAVAGAAGAITALAGAGVAAGAALAPLAGLAPVYIAAFGAVKVATLTTKLAMVNMSQAFKDIGAPAAQFQKDLDKLAPSARSFAIEVRALKPAFDRLQISVQQRFFNGLAGQIKTVASSLLPQLRRGLDGVATSLSIGARGALSSIQQSLGGGVLQQILQNIAKGIRAITPAAQYMIQAFVQIGKVGTQYLPGVATLISEIAYKFNQFIQAAAQSGALSRFVSGGIVAFSNLLTIVSNLAVGIGHVLQAAAPLGGLLLGKLGLVSEAFKSLTGSASGQNALKGFFSSLQPVLAVIGQLVAALAKAIVPLIPIVLKVAQILGTQLVKVVNSLAPGLKAFGGILVGLAGPIGQIANAIASGLSTALVSLTPLIKPVASALSALAPVVSALVSNILTPFPDLLLIIANLFKTLAPAITPLIGVIGQLINAGLQALAPIIAVLAKLISQLIQQGLKVLQPYIPIITKGLVLLGQGIATALLPLMPVLTKAFVQILQGIVPLIPVFVKLLISTLPVVTLLARLAADIIPPLMRVLRPILPIIAGLAAVFLLLGNPIGEVILITVALGVAWRSLPTIANAVVKGFHAFINFFTHTIPAAFKTVINYISDHWKVAVFVAPVAVAVIQIVKHWAAIKTAITNGISQMVTWFKRLPGQLSRALGNLGSLLYSKGASLISGLWNGAVHIWNAVIAWMKSRGRAAWNALGNLGMTIYDKGKALLTGFLNGQKAGWTNIWNWFKSLPAKFAGNLGWATTLINKGGALIQGLYDGISNKISGVGGWIKRNVIDPIVNSIKSFFGIHSPSTVMADIGGNLIAGLLHGLAVSNGGAIARKVFGDMPHALGKLVDKSIVSLSKLPKKALSALKGIGYNIGSTGASKLGLGKEGNRNNQAVGANQAYAKSVMGHFGFNTGGDFAALKSLWTGESGWNQNAANPTSSAYGIAQFLDSTWAGMPYGKTSDPNKQIIDGLTYIKASYGNPQAAYGAWLSRNPHWYGGGLANGIFTKPTMIGVGERGSERVSVTPLSRPGASDGFDYDRLISGLASVLSQLDFTTTLEADHIALARVVKKGNKNLAWLGK